MEKRDLNTLALAATTLLSSGCATGPGRTAGDPLEPMNRTIYSFNDKVDTYVLKPTAKVYQNVMPSPVQTAVRNFFFYGLSLRRKLGAWMRPHTILAERCVTRANLC